MRVKLVLLPLIFVLLLATFFPSLVKAADPVLRISPSSNTAEVNAQFSFDVTVSGVAAEKSLIGWAITLKFNPSVINAVNATEGSFLKNIHDTVVLAPEINNTAGTIYFGAVFLPPFPTSGAVGDGTLATFIFKAVSVGSSSLHFEYSEETEYTRLYTVISNNQVPIAHTREDGSFSNGSSNPISGAALPLEVIAAVVVVVAVGAGGAFFFWRRRRSKEE